MPVKPGSAFTHCEDIQGDVKTHWSFAIPEDPTAPARFSHAERRQRDRNGRWALVSAWKAGVAEEAPPVEVQRAANTKVAAMFMRLRRSVVAVMAGPSVMFQSKPCTVRFERGALIFYKPDDFDGTRVSAWSLHRHKFSPDGLAVLRSLAPKRSDMIAALAVYPKAHHAEDMNRRTYILDITFKSVKRSKEKEITLSTRVSDAEAARVRADVTAWRAVLRRLEMDPQPMGEPLLLTLTTCLGGPTWTYDTKRGNLGARAQPFRFSYPLSDTDSVVYLYERGYFVGRVPKQIAYDDIRLTLGRDYWMWSSMRYAPHFDLVAHESNEWRFRLLPTDPWSSYSAQRGLKWRGSKWEEGADEAETEDENEG